MKIILLGAPGSGKGTQSEFLQKKFNLLKISTGDLLRQTIAEGNEFGKKIDSYVNAGKLVPDDLIIGILKDYIEKTDCPNGYILDGFPRTIAQANALTEAGININLVIRINVDESKLIERLSGRLTHLNSGRVYHKIFNPPKQPGIDDITGEPLVQRKDDQVSTIKERLESYNKQTAQLFELYSKMATDRNDLEFITIDGNAPITSIQTKLNVYVQHVEQTIR